MKPAAPRRAPALMAALAALFMAAPSPARNLTPKIQKHVLDNGLRVYLLEDRAAPIVTFQFWVEVGSADEHEGAPGITGLSHFFEHMMFRGTPRYKDYFKEISKRGGQLNAFTWLDVTVYWEKVAASDLEFVLDIESDRLQHMKVDFLNLEPEREVVKSERLLRTENSASGSLYEAVGATLFKAHSYRWPTVGWMRDLNAITVEQAQDYHARFYVPNNAFLVLVGDFEAKKALALIEKYYGSFAKRPVKRPERKAEPPITGERRIFVEKPTGTGLFNVSYRSPAGKDPDFVVMAVVEELLTGGKTSRLQKALVYGKDPLAKGVSAFAFPFVDPSMLAIEVEMLPGKANRAAEERLSAEIDKLSKELVPKDELARAVAQLRADVVRVMATTHSRAQLIGFAVRASDDPTMPWQLLKKYGEVTPEQVRAVVKKYLGKDQRVVGHALDLRLLPKLAAKMVAKHPSVAKADEVFVQVVQHSLAMFQLRQEQSAMAMEDKAIELLARRAAKERKRLEGNTSALAELDKYLNEGEKGIKQRKAKLAKRRTALAAARKQLGEQRAKLKASAEELTKTKGDGAKWIRTEWARVLLGDHPLDPATLAPRGSSFNSPDTAERALGLLVLRHLFGRRDIDVAGMLAKVAPTEGVLLDLWNFAHMGQLVDAGRM